ncbi:MAG: PEGA domain-containing protein [Gammaproteobacteria bacterium]|nr:PEGA domain-containing protein [Gammaproteobacteria bacterium]
MRLCALYLVAIALLLPVAAGAQDGSIEKLLREAEELEAQSEERFVVDEARCQELLNSNNLKEITRFLGDYPDQSLDKSICAAQLALHERQVRQLVDEDRCTELLGSEDIDKIRKFFSDYSAKSLSKSLCAGQLALHVRQLSQKRARARVERQHAASKVRQDMDFCAKLKKSEDLQDFKDYQRLFSGGFCDAYVEERIKNLQKKPTAEALFCKKLGDETTRESLERYQGEYPEGGCLVEVERLLGRLLEQERYVSLVVRSNVSNDKVYIDDEPQRPTGPQPFRLVKGKRYEIRVEKPDYEPWTRSLLLEENKTLYARLKKPEIPAARRESEPEPEPEVSETPTDISIQVQEKSQQQRRADEEKLKVRTQCENTRGSVPTACLKEDFGCLSGDCRNGFGIMRYRKGICYWGDWVDGEKSGRGGWYTPKRSRAFAAVIAGEVRNGKILIGVYAYASGACFVGETDKATRKRVRGSLLFADGRLAPIGSR